MNQVDDITVTFLPVLFLNASITRMASVKKANIVTRRCERALFTL